MYTILADYYHTCSIGYICVVAVRTNDHAPGEPDEWKVYIGTYPEYMGPHSAQQRVAALGAPILDMAIAHAYFPQLDISRYKKEK